MIIFIIIITCIFITIIFIIFTICLQGWSMFASGASKFAHVASEKVSVLLEDN